jgi:hypothetical protein
MTAVVGCRYNNNTLKFHEWTRVSNCYLWAELTVSGASCSQNPSSRLNFPAADGRKTPQSRSRRTWRAGSRGTRRALHSQSHRPWAANCRLASILPSSLAARLGQLQRRAIDVRVTRSVGAHALSHQRWSTLLPRPEAQHLWMRAPAHAHPRMGTARDACPEPEAT